MQGVIRWKLRLDWIINQLLSFPFNKLDPYVLNILRMSVYQIYFMNKVPEFAIVNESVTLAKAKGKHVANIVNAVLRNLCRNKDKIKFPDKKEDPIKFLSIFYSYPKWLIKKWIKELGWNDTEKLLEIGNKPPNITIRVNRLKTSRDILVTKLSQLNIKTLLTKYSPDGIIIKKLALPISEIPSYKKGLFFVQDEASQLCSYILKPEPGDKILDICAGLGLKSLHIAELIKKKGKIIALDINPKRLLILAHASLRCNIDIIKPVIGNALYASSFFNCTFDKILVDAPCSGLGTISKHPDIKWTKSEKDIKKILPRIQINILNEASKLLNKHGKILYATCTISKEENEMVVFSFLKNHPEMKLLDISSEIPWLKDLTDKNGFFKSYPHVHNMDGFFCALFCKS